MTTEREQILALARKAHAFAEDNETDFYEVLADQLLAARKPMEEEIKRERASWSNLCYELHQQLAAANEERAWIRRKLKLPEDAEFLSGSNSVAGTMHNVCAGNHGYHTYIETEKCDDKAGLISRLTVQLAAANARISELEAQGDPVKCKTCNGSGSIWKSLRHGESDFQEWEDDCPDCDATGHLRAPQAVPEWQPIETAPEAQHVFVWLPNYGTVRGIYTLDQGRQRWWNGEEVIYPTHWMPLPAAPSPEGDKKP